jgi:streptogramin lyase
VRGFMKQLAASIGVIATLAIPSDASAIDEFPAAGLPAGTRPGGITTGPDGALWFTEEGTHGIGRLTTSGVYSRIQLTIGSTPDQIVAGPDGRLWFTESGRNKIGAITTAGVVSEYPVSGNTGAQPQGITVGPDGKLWFTEANANSAIRSIDPTSGNLGSPVALTSSSEPSDIETAAGKLWVTEQATSVSKIAVYDPSTAFLQEIPASPGSEPSSIIATAGGVLWFTEAGTSAIGKITSGGTPPTEYPGTAASPSGIAAGQDGALWFTESPPQASPVTSCPPAPGFHGIGRITSGGTITNNFATPTPSSEPSDITVGPDGALWFSEYCADKIGRIATAPSAPPPPPPPPVVKTLSVSSLKLSPTKFRAASSGASITKKAKTGTTVSYRLSLAATIRFTVERPQPGRKSGKKCVKPKRGKKGKRCTRYVVLKGRFQHVGKAGANKFHFSGRVGGKKLRPGSYRLVAVATAGATKSKLKRANFKIVR